MFLTEHGKHNFHFYNTSAAKRNFGGGKNTAEGCHKWQNMIPMLHVDGKKNMFLTEHEKHYFHSCNPSRVFLIFFARHARLRVGQAGSASRSGTWVCSWAPTTRAGGEDYVSLHNKLPQIIQLQYFLGGGQPGESSKQDMQ